MLLLVVLVQTSSTNAESVGRWLLNATWYFQLFIVLFATPALSAGLIAIEKQQRTIGLLLMADLRGWDIYLSKFFAVALEIFLLLITPLPILAIAAFFGGVSITEMAIQGALLCVAAFTICAIGLFASTIASRPSEALLITVLAMAAWIGGTAFFDASPWGRIRQINIITAAQYPDLASPWPALAICAVIAVATIPTAVLLLPRQAYEKETRANRRRRSRLRLANIIPVNPAVQLLASNSSGIEGAIRWAPIRAIISVMLAAMVFIPCLGDLLFMLLFFYSVISSVGHIRESGALEDLLTTPTNRRNLAHALLGATLIRSSLFYLGLAAIGFPKWMFVMYSEMANEIGAGTSLWDLSACIFLFVLFTIVQYITWITFACTIGLQPGRPAMQTLFALILATSLYLMVAWMSAIGIFATAVIELPPVFYFGGFFGAIGILYVIIAYSSYTVLVDWVDKASYLAKPRAYL
jgi:ABC-type transport system involved in multi-copper enzyme maturation permease subunit